MSIATLSSKAQTLLQAPRGRLEEYGLQYCKACEERFLDARFSQLKKPAKIPHDGELVTGDIH